MKKTLTYSATACAGALAVVLAATGAEPPTNDAEPTLPPDFAAKIAKAMGRDKDDDLPKFDKVAKDYKKVVSTADGKQSLYTIWTREKDAQMLAELPRNYSKQLLFWAYTIAGGTPTAGVQSGDIYATWKRFDKRLALVEPNFEVRSTGDLESKKGRDRVFTDRVILDVPIVANGPSGGPVIDLDALLLGKSTSFFGFRTRLAVRYMGAEGIPRKSSAMNPSLLSITSSQTEEVICNASCTVNPHTARL